MTYDLERFKKAQDGATWGATYEDALGEIREGCKLTHWIWYVFPQLKGLGRSGMAEKYGISGMPEAEAYLADPVLGARLVEISEALLEHRGTSAQRILGPIDAIKVRSCMTLFARVPGSSPVFREVLDVFYDGKEDELTIELLGR
ncbi:MAG: DUF1810 domain-containing protein [Atopobiaceae bacterium]|nr:DUF1810 domain-containing protein [Atopobiaceae bacterium]